MNRWVGLGVIADNVLNLGRAIEEQTILSRSCQPSCLSVAPLIPARFAFHRTVDYHAATRQFCAGK